MTTPEIVAYVLVGLGLAAGAYIAAQRPAFWMEFGARAIRAITPALWAWLSKRMPPDDERAFRDCVRRGGEWDHIRRRCKH